LAVLNAFFLLFGGPVAGNILGKALYVDSLYNYFYNIQTTAVFQTNGTIQKV